MPQSGDFYWNDVKPFLVVVCGAAFAAAAKEFKCEMSTVGRCLANFEEKIGRQVLTRVPGRHGSPGHRSG